MNEKRLFLLDAYALIFRAYYALIRVPRVTSQGFNTSAVFGFVNTLEELLRKENPTHVAVCFDPQGPTFRHEAYEDYKGEREATPEDIKLSIPYIKRIVEAYRIPIIEVPGFEADDVIGTMALRAQAEGFTTFMMTPDKDFAQLVSPHIFQYKPSYRGQDFEVRGVREVCERYGIERTSQVIDLLALMGDKVDNIPGCPGVGEKTAIKLIGEFGSVENLIAGADRLKGAIKKKVEENAEQIVFSKYLATIRTDVPLEVSASDLERRDADAEALSALFDELEFRQLKERVMRRIGARDTHAGADAVQGSLFDMDEKDAGGEAPTVPPPSSIESQPHEYRQLDSEAAWTEMEDAVGKAGCVALDVVAPGEGDMSAPALYAAVATGEGRAYCVVCPDAAQSRRLLDIMALPQTRVVCHDIKRAYVALRNAALSDGGAEPVRPACYFDVSLAHYLLQPDQRHDLPLMASHYLNRAMLDPDALLPPGRSSVARRFAEMSAEAAVEFACERADMALRLYPVLSDALERQDMVKLFEEIEQPLAMVLADMEITGVCVDVDALGDAARQINARIENLEKEIWDMAGEEFNIGSPGRVGEILFDKLKLDPKAKKLKSGRYSTNEEVLEKIAHLNPIVGRILDYRRLRKLVNTYLTALPENIDPRTGRIHTTYNQTVTATGRISSSDPNLQNIPVRQGDGREIRRAFTASPGRLFLSADYSQIELRLVADFADDEVMLQAFRDGTDIHAVTAARIFHKDVADVTPDERRKAKTANFGILYGISAFGLANRLNISRSEAKELIDSYFAMFPSIRRYMNESIEHAREQGYVATIHNRRRILPDISSRNPVVRGYAERNAINAPIQGSAADIIKIAMVAIDREMRERRMQSRMIMQVHDELNFDVVPDELPQMQELVERQMRQAYSGRVPLTAEAGVGPDWLTAH